MPVKPHAIKQRVRDFEFRKLFIVELGWNNPGGGLEVPLNDRTFQFTGVAEKCGLQVFECSIPESEEFPDYQTRLKLEWQIAKSAREHMLIFTDAARTRQVWLWVKRETNSPTRPRQETFTKGDTGERLAQKLQLLAFDLDEEEKLTLVDVASRRRQAFDVEKVTKKFYERFQKEHQAFFGFIEGLATEADRSWYASLMLNRLMFVYFIQKKRFLNNDPDYLRNKLKEVQQHSGKGKFHDFYRHFLLRLFHEGLGKKRHVRGKELDQLLGDVPYLNGGLFDVHELEIANKSITIPDEAFAKLFEFFDAYQWHLDERPLRTDNEINPDVLGYIFEKYINQKQMGAYYTKEDITGYIARNTFLPFILTRAQEECEVAFKTDGTVWKLLKDDPDRYIYDAVRKGVDLPLPDAIAAGLTDVNKRAGWNKPAVEGFALPTETWREHISRRQRCEELREKLRNSQVTSANDLVTLNLDIARFVTDVIVGCEGSNLLQAIYQTLTKVSILDPTCGSGAFLFAALNLLQPLYDACLDRMQAFIEEAERADPDTAKQKYQDFRVTLKEVDLHPSRRYFVLKTIVVNNLYGVDIMDEAVEICKLRLFLKLVAQVDKTEQLEPLPDIDFNVRPGNTLVGFASLDEARKMVDLISQSDMDAIQQAAEELDQKFRIFREHQTRMQEGQLALNFSKKDLRERMNDLRDRLDRYLAGAYGVKVGDEKAFRKWHDSHKPFHWCVEFYGIMSGGGFDVLIGNPPWKEYSAVRKEYTVKGFRAEACGNLHGICTERALRLRSPNGGASFIVQLPLVSSSRMRVVRQLLHESSGFLWVLPFDDRPGKLFDGLQHCRSVIFISFGSATAESASGRFVTAYQRWPTMARNDLFPRIEFVPLLGGQIFSDQFAKLATTAQETALLKVAGAATDRLGAFQSTRESKHFIFYQEATQYWVKATVGLPYYAKNGKVGAPAHGRYLYFDTSERTHAACAVLNSSLFYTYFITYGDCFHLSDGLATGFPVTDKVMADGRLVGLNKKLLVDLKEHAVKKVIRTRDGDEIRYEEFYASESKPIIDQIDAILAEHYGFTTEELDFIQNYDIKYRLGAEDGQEANST